MRFPLIMMVVVMHGMGMHYYITSYPNYMLIEGGEFNIYFFIKRLFYNLSTLAVPVFYLISGYLFFAKGFSKEIYTEKIKKRIWTLLIPYLIWNVILWTLTIAFGQYRPSLYQIFWSMNDETWYGGTNYLGYEFIPASAPINYPLWYVRDLMCLCVCSPLIYMCIKYLKIGIIVILGGVYISYVWPHIEFNSEGLLFFTWGGYLSLNNKLMQINNHYLFCGGLIVTLMCGMILALSNGLVSEVGFYLRPYYTIIGTVLFLNIFLRIKSTKVSSLNKEMAGSVFFIYVSHAVVIKILTASQFFLFGSITVQNTFLAILVDCVLIPPLIALIGIGVYFFIRKNLPWVTKILIGSR